jgi:plasmid stabilization system protein ParE
VTRPVSLRPQAQAEARRAKVWYEEQVPGLGGQFVRALDAAVAAITEHPETFPKVYGEFRQCLIRRFPYSIYFRISEDAIVIIAVHHQRRDPARWQRRAV